MSAPVRALFVCASLGEGGAERFVATALAHLDRARVAPHLALFRDDLGYGLPDDVPLEVLDKRRPWDIPIAMGRLARLVDRLRPDVVLSAFAHPNFVTGCALALARQRPRWIARVSNDPERGETGAPRAAMRRLYRRAERIVCNAEALAGAFRSAYPPLAGRVAVLPNPVDFARLDALAAEAGPAERVALVGMGRLCRQKRFDLAIDALARLPAERGDRLRLLGEGPEREALQRHARDRSVADRVDFAGFVANPFPWLAAADVFVLSSDHEGLPHALIEAQGLGLPAVASDCPYGPAEIVESGTTGLLVPPGDAAALAQALETLLGDAGLRERMGAAARQRARERFAVAPLVRRLEDYLVGSSTAGCG